MLNPSPKNPYFDFRATPPETTSLFSYGCSIKPTFPLAFWHGLSPPIANYALLAWIVLFGGIISLLTTAATALLFVGFRHFQSLHRSRFEHLRFPDKFFGIVCKGFPWVTNVCVGLMICTVAIPLVLVFTFNVCNATVLEASGSLNKIHNCRLWVEECVKDFSQYGRHLQCSLPENYRAFPAEPCDRDPYVACVFPQSSLADTTIDLTDGQGICGGEPYAPHCPMCIEARRDERTNVHNKYIGPDGQLRIATSMRRSRSVRRHRTRQPSGSLPSDTPLDEADVNDEVEALPQNGSERVIGTRRRRRRPVSFLGLTSHSTVHARRKLSDNRNVGSPLSLVQNKTSLELQRQKQNLTTRRRTSRSYRRHSSRATRLILIPRLTFQKESDAFYYSYVRTLYYFQEGSYAVRMINIWTLISVFIIFIYKVAYSTLSSIIQPDGYFVTPGTAKLEIKAVFSKLLTIFSFGRFSSPQLLKHVD